jgi:hypothetical protein
MGLCVNSKELDDRARPNGWVEPHRQIKALSTYERHGVLDV